MMMSCSGCRVLRKGCNNACVLRRCIQWIDGAAAQGHATAFVAKFFGRTTLLSALSSVPSCHRPAAFRSLLYEACGRTINPVSGATGLLWAGNWHLCHAAVDTVLAGGKIQPPPELTSAAAAANAEQLYRYQKRGASSSSASSPPGKRRRSLDEYEVCDLHLCLMPSWSPDCREDSERHRASTPSATTSESSVTIMNAGRPGDHTAAAKPAMLNLFL